MTRPSLVSGARLVYDEVRGENALLVPEGVVLLNSTAAVVLELCDGARSLDEIISVLSIRYDRVDLGDDVRGLLDAMAHRGLVADAAS
jgi:pyrroloquinoline quinone biosynthesis protein D